MTQDQQNNLKFGIGAAVAGLAVYLLFFKGKETGTGTGDPTGNGGTNTAYNFDAHKVATDVYEILKQTGFTGAWVNSDDAAALLEILTPVNEDQFGQVITKFGQLEYNPLLGDQSSFFWQTLDKYGLVFWLKKELPINTEIYRTLKAKYPKYL